MIFSSSYPRLLRFCELILFMPVYRLGNTYLWFTMFDFYELDALWKNYVGKGFMPELIELLFCLEDCVCMLNVAPDIHQGLSVDMLLDFFFWIYNIVCSLQDNVQLGFLAIHKSQCSYELEGFWVYLKVRHIQVVEPFYCG